VNELAKIAVGDDRSPEYNEKVRQIMTLVTGTGDCCRTSRAARGGIVRRGITLPSEPTARALAQAVARRAKHLEMLYEDDRWVANNAALQQRARSERFVPRIVGGEPVAIGDVRFCVAIVCRGTNYCCTGTLIQERFVVTAAHCLPGRIEAIFVGNNTVTGAGQNARRVRVVRQHEFSYDAGTSRNDIALLELEAPVTDVKPCRIATAEEVKEARDVRLVGFGQSEYDYGGKKRQVVVPVATLDTGRYGEHPGLELVAGGAGKDTCYGDSGGPAFIEKGDELILAGVTSRGILAECGPGGIYVRPDAYRAEIEKVTGSPGPEPDPNPEPEPKPEPGPLSPEVEEAAKAVSDSLRNNVTAFEEFMKALRESQ